MLLLSYRSWIYLLVNLFIQTEISKCRDTFKVGHLCKHAKLLRNRHYGINLHTINTVYLVHLFAFCLVHFLVYNIIVLCILISLSIGQTEKKLFIFCLYKSV
jgi:hypothetical protein